MKIRVWHVSVGVLAVSALLWVGIISFFKGVASWL